jgi:Tol biopolymer transport system component
MSLETGARLGSYEIVGAIGVGGMGEVFRARDTKLERDVAIKILPSAFSTDPERLARFEREARLLAALNHPHIGAIYGVDDTGPAPALILELIEGPTLADHIQQGVMPVTEALRIASQIAGALEAAHDKGIIHRDLKPANVKVTPGGVKVLDFGLAKTATDTGAGLGQVRVDPSNSPTITIDGTRDGVILGTAAYMSPEQARGKPVDKRTDIWALGCVLFEMLTGRKPFHGETVTDTMAAILEREPDWRTLPPATPAGVRRLLERCLEKDLQQRLRDAGDARLELEDALGRKVARRPTDLEMFRQAAPWIAGVSITAGVIAIGVYAWNARGHNGSRAQVPAMKFTQLTSDAGAEWFPSLSPDGKWVAYAGETRDKRDIYLQSVTGKTAINLTSDSSDNDDQPAFSPDGERIAFRSSRDGGGIFVMGRTGESVRRVTRSGFRPTWSPDAMLIAYASQNVELNPQNTEGTSELWVVNVSSGELTRLNAGDAALPSWSPRGSRIAYTKRLGDGRQRDIWTISLRTGQSAPVTADAATDWSPSWSPDGFLYFSSDRGGSMNLWRVEIDEETGNAVGALQPVTTPAPFLAHATVAAGGSRIAYSAVIQTRNLQRAAFDPGSGTFKGDPGWLTTGSRSWSNPDLSPDAQSLAFYSAPPEEKIHVARADGGAVRQLTSDAAVIDRVPRWSPDGKWIAFFSNRSGTYQVWKIRPDGSELQQLTEAGDDVRYPIWSPDGSRMAVSVIGKTPEAGQVYLFDPSRPWKDQMPQTLPALNSPHRLFVVNSWSSDGQNLVGQAGTVTQGIVTYSLRSNTFDRLTDFGEFPVWLPDSQRVLFVSGGKDFYVVDAKSKAVRKVFTGKRDVIGPAQLSRDGRQAVFSRRVTEADIWLLAFDASGSSHRQ